MKISLIGSYNLADGYLGAAKALIKNGVQVEFIPAHRYFSDNNNNHVDLIINDLKSQNPDVALWWRAETLTEANIFRIKNAVKIPFIMFSWDDPHQFEATIRNVREKIKHFNICFTCCEGSINEYLNEGCPNVVYCHPGFDEEVHFPEEDDIYKCDISLVCTNLYHGNSITKFHHLSRKILIEHLINNFPNLDIRIYGSESISSIFPNHYKGWISFNESRKVFYNSKINISTHIRPDGYKYFNERVCQILGSKGLLMVDHVNGFDSIIKNGKECVVMDLSTNNSILDQVNDILRNKEKYDEIRENGHSLALKKLNWNVWSNTIIKNIKEFCIIK